MKPTLFWKATGKLIDFIDWCTKSKVRVSGVDNIGNGPVLFVSNHFTRFETGLIPWVVYKNTGRITRTLADDYLFQSPIKGFLESANVFSNKNPCYKTEITRDLATGNCDWVIYPEGGMIKNKLVVNDDGELWLPTPWRIGPPRTGCAVFALMSEALRQLALSKNTKKSNFAKFQMDLNGPSSLVSNEPIKIVPITFSYYPLRPENNFLHKTVHRYIKHIPLEFEDELLVEGNLLLGKTVIDVHFGKPIEIEGIIKDYWKEKEVDFYDFDNSLSKLVVDYKDEITNKAMSTVYNNNLFNVDHLITAILNYSDKSSIKLDNLILRIFLLGQYIKKMKDVRISHITMKTTYEAVIGEINEAIQDYLAVASSTGVIDIDKEHGVIHVDKQVLRKKVGFGVQRSHNPCSVILNEVKAIKKVKKLSKRISSLSLKQIKEEVSNELYSIDKENYEYELQFGDCCSQKDCSPEMVINNESLGVVACHGYLSNPKEMKLFCDYLNKNNISYYNARLAGHGTDPKHLDTTTRENWIDSLDIAVEAMKLRCSKIIVVGFSTGGLVASNIINDNPGVVGFCGVNIPIGIKDKNLRFVESVMNLNRALSKININSDVLRSIPNNSETPDVNYSINYLNGVEELLKLKQESKENFQKVQIPTLLIQSNNDPTVNPNSVKTIYDLLPCKDKKMKYINSDNHICLTDGNKYLIEYIISFIKNYT